MRFAEIFKTELFSKYGQKAGCYINEIYDIIKIKIKGLFDVIIGGNNMSENQVKITYKPLWKLLIDRDMTKTELRKKTQIAPSTFTKMNNDQQVSLDILARICVELKCGFDDIVEIER